MSQLGHLLWWTVAEGEELDCDTLTELLKDTGVTVPARRLPVDVFRRMTGPDVKKVYDLDDGYTLEVTLAPVDSKNDQMLIRHMVGTLKNAQGVVQTIAKIGDLAFYKPPRNQHSKARLRIVPGTAKHPVEAEDFAQNLRSQYDKGVKGALNSQSVRRAVRDCLAGQEAVYLGGPYFVERLDQGEALRALFDRLGGNSFMHIVQLEDTPEHRRVIWGESA